MTGRRMLAAAVVPLLLASCATDPGAPGERDDARFAVKVDVDTPELRALKKEAGVEQCAQGDDRAEPAAGGMPDIVLPCLGGGPEVNVASLRGPMVVNLWAQWCGPCAEELPFYQRLHERAGGKLRVLGIDYQDTQPRLALELVRDTGVTFPSVADPAAQMRVPLKVRGLPGVVFVDKFGRITHIEYVVIRSYAQLRDLVEAHLGLTIS